MATTNDVAGKMGKAADQIDRFASALEAATGRVSRMAGNASRSAAAQYRP